MHILDIIITLALVAFVATRFFGYKLPIDKTLGKKKKSSKQHGAPKAGAEVVTLPQKPEKDMGKVPGLLEVKRAMPDFREKTFLEGAKKAYKYFHAKRNDMDAEALEPLLAPHLLDEILTEMETLDAKGKTFEINVKTIEAADLLEARLNGRTALIQVQFTATQAEGTKKAKAVKTVWTFARPVDADDPNWDVTNIEAVN